MNPAEPLVPTKPESEDVMEIGAEDEEVLSTPVTKKGKEKAQGSGKPPKVAKWVQGDLGLPRGMPNLHEQHFRIRMHRRRLSPPTRSIGYPPSFDRDGRQHARPKTWIVWSPICKHR